MQQQQRTASTAKRPCTASKALLHSSSARSDQHSHPTHHLTHCFAHFPYPSRMLLATPQEEEKPKKKKAKKSKEEREAEAEAKQAAKEKKDAKKAKKEAKASEPKKPMG